jgi:hypothetical protein
LFTQTELASLHASIKTEKTALEELKATIEANTIAPKVKDTLNFNCEEIAKLISADKKVLELAFLEIMMV